MPKNRRLSDSYNTIHASTVAMPLFEYRCPTCDKEFELLVRNQDVPACPDCGTDQLEKLLSVAAAPGSSHRALLPIAGGCPPSDAPPCGPGCCRLP